MAGDRYVVLGLGRPRLEWFRAVAQWSTSAAIPAEFLKCVSVEELRTRIRSGRRHSAVLLDGALPHLDRDLIDLARDAGCAVLVVDDGRVGIDWRALGATAVLPATLTREVLLDALVTHAPVVPRAAIGTVDLTDGDEPVATGAVAAACGPGGTGASTVAAALAEGLAASRARSVVLADLALQAEQAMLHDVRDVVPGIQELIEAHRSRRPTADEVAALTYFVVERGYHLLLGLRRARYWSTLRPRAFGSSFASLRSTFDVTVCDVSADFEGEDDGGSADVEERNVMARTAVRSADAVFAVGRPGPKGVHSLVRVITDLIAVGVEARRIVPVVNLAPRHPRARAELAAVIAQLTAHGRALRPLAPALFLPVRRIDEAVRDAVRFPAPLASTLSNAFDAVLREDGPTSRRADRSVLVRPGAFGGAFGVDAAP